MKLKNRAIFILALVTFALLMHPGVTPRGAAQDTQQLRLIRESFIVVPAIHGCYPVEVRGIALGGSALNVLLAQVTVENRSRKTVTAVKLGWKVHKSIRGRVPRDLLCGVPPESKALLSGNTPLISLGQLAPNETCHIGPNPLVYKGPATLTVFIDYPILIVNDVKSLPLDETRRAPQYDIALYIAEIHYADGSTWTFENSQPPLVSNNESCLRNESSLRLGGPCCCRQG